MRSIKLISKDKPKEDLEVKVDTVTCEICTEEDKKGLTFVNDYHQLCFDCIDALHKIMISPAERGS